MQMKFISTYGQVNNIDISLTTTEIVKIVSETNTFGIWAGTNKWHVTGIARLTWYGINIRITTDKTFITFISYDPVWYKFSAGALFIPVL